MKHPSLKENWNRTSLLPTRIIITTVAVLGFAILGSAIFNTTTLFRLRESYLSNRGHEIAAVLDGQARGPGRRNNPIFWQSLLETNYAAYSASVAFLSLVDQNRGVLAYKGASTQIPRLAQSSTSDVYVFEEPLVHPRNPRNEATGWRIQVGLLASDANYIRHQALLQLAISGIAVLTLIVLSVSLIRTLNRFLEMKVREGAEAQLKSIGVMAASLAHEIRNPLGAMKGLTQLAQEDLPQQHAAQQKLQTVVSESERLERLVTDLLDFAHTKEPQISEFDLVDILSDLKTMLRSKLESSNVTLRLSTDSNRMNIRSDPAGLKQILLNVLMNAMDATPESGFVALTAKLNEGGQSLYIQIDDSGKGLGETNPEDLFHPFVTKKVRGTGLGLAVSRQIAESLGGSLRLENLPETGARCSITLPIT